MSAAPTGSLFGTQSVRIQEILNKTIDFLLPTMDPFWRQTVATSTGVGPVNDLGRDLKIIKIFLSGFSGVLEQAGPRDDFTLYGDNLNSNLGAKLFLQGQGFSANANVFPDALQGPNPRPFRLGIPMRAMVGNLAMTMGEMMAEALPATIGDIIAPKLEGFARQISHTVCNYWYLSQNTYYRLAVLPAATGTGSFALSTPSGMTANSGFIFQPVGYQVDRFIVGQRVQFYDSTGVTIRTANGGGTTSLFYVIRVDELTNTVEVMTSDNTAIGTLNTGNMPSVNDIVVYANSKGTSGTPFSGSPYFTGCAGINSFLKTGDGTNTDNTANCLLGAERDTGNVINVGTHGEFKSFGYDMAGQPLTEHTLRKILRRFHAAKNKYGQYLDCLVASDGVWLAYEGQKIGREILNRTGRLSSIQNEGSEGSDYGYEGMKFSFDGRDYDGYTSTYIDSGTLYGTRKGGNNWKRYVPPTAKGVQRFEKADTFAPYEFVAGALTGTSSNQIPIFRVVNNQNLLTEFVQMPGMLRMQLVPDQPAGLKLINCAEDRLYSATNLTLT